MKLLIFVIIFFTQSVFARSKNVTVFFLSAQKFTFEFQPPIFFSPLMAQNENCEKVEGGCFDPQRGFIADKDFKPKTPKPQMGIEGFSGNMIKCEKGNYFDLYCGKSRQQINAKNIHTGVWIDISGSMKDEDVSNDGMFCHRRSFAEKIIKSCHKNVVISQFTTSLNTVGSPATLCKTSGTNNTKKLIQWIESSKYQQLYIVTDVEENNVQFSSYLSKIGAKSIGIGTEEFYVTGLEGYIKDIISLCQK